MFYAPFVIFEIYFKDQPVDLITTIPVSSTATLSSINSSVNYSLDPSINLIRSSKKKYFDVG